MPRLNPGLASSAIAGAAIWAATASAAVPAVSMMGSGRPVDLRLTDFDIAPEIVHLRAGQRVFLQITNDSPLPHDLTAPEFFAASLAPAAEASAVKEGRIAIRPRESLALVIEPRAGRYSMKCSHPLHKMLGMSGTIVVDP